MNLTVPTVEQVSKFSGRPVSEYTAFIDEALLQAALMLKYAGVTEMPEEEDEITLIRYAISQMADSLYLSQPFDKINASPIVSQSMGSTSYSRAAYGKFLERIKAGAVTGVFWFDLCVTELGVPVNEPESGSLILFERDLETYCIGDGREIILSPKDDLYTSRKLAQEHIVHDEFGSSTLFWDR